MKKNPIIFIPFYSMYGHIFTLAQAIAQGVEQAGGTPLLKQVEELVPEHYWNEPMRAAKSRMSTIPFANPRTDLKNIDGLIMGTPTRYGNMCAQMRNFWDQTGSDWQAGTLIGKPAGVFTSTGSQHGGQETTLTSSMLTLMHLGCIIVGLPYSFKEQIATTEIHGGSPYGPSTIAGAQGERVPTTAELTMARDFGSYLTTITKKLS